MDRFVTKLEGWSSEGSSAVIVPRPPEATAQHILIVSIGSEDSQVVAGGPAGWRDYGTELGLRPLSVWGKKVTSADLQVASFQFNLSFAFPVTWALTVWRAAELPDLIGSGIGLEAIGPTFDYMPEFARPYDLAIAVTLGRLEPGTNVLPGNTPMVERASRALQFNSSNRLVVWDGGEVEKGERLGIDTQTFGASELPWFLLGYANAGDGVPAIEVSSADDMAQPFNDLDARVTLSFMDRLDPKTPAVLTDALGQVIARGTPVNPPALDSSRASYGLRSILGRMAQAPINRPVVVRLESPNNTAREALEATLTALKLEFAWLEWEPIPDLDLQTSVGTLTPRIDIVYHKPEARAAERKTVLGLLEELLEPFVLAGYEFAPSEANRFEVRPPARKQDTGQAIPLGWDKISREGITEIEPRFSPATVATLNYKPWSFQSGIEVAEPSSIRIMPSYWQPDGSYGPGQQAPWLPNGFPGLGNWPPKLTDSQGPISAPTHKELRLDVALLFYGGVFPLVESWLADTNTQATLPLLEGVFLQSGSSVSLDLTLKRWSYYRDPPPPGLQEPSAMPDLTFTATLPTDGQEHLLWDATDFWVSGLQNRGREVVYRVYGTYNGGAVQLRVFTSLYQGTVWPFNRWDFGTVLQIEATGSVYAQRSQEVNTTLGEPGGASYAQDITKIPWLPQAQEEHGLDAVVLSIEKYSLAIEGQDEPSALRFLLESVLRERSRPRRRWQVPLGILAPGVTPFMVNKLVAVPFTHNGLGLLVGVTSSKSTRSGRFHSEVTAIVEELPEEFAALFFDGSSLLLSGLSGLEV